MDYIKKIGEKLFQTETIDDAKKCGDLPAYIVKFIDQNTEFIYDTETVKELRECCYPEKKIDSLYVLNNSFYLHAHVIVRMTEMANNFQGEYDYEEFKELLTEFCKFADFYHSPATSHMYNGKLDSNVEGLREKIKRYQYIQDKTAKVKTFGLQPIIRSTDKIKAICDRKKLLLNSNLDIGHTLQDVRGLVRNNNDIPSQIIENIMQIEVPKYKNRIHTIAQGAQMRVESYAQRLDNNFQNEILLQQAKQCLYNRIEPSQIRKHIYPWQTT